MYCTGSSAFQSCGRSTVNTGFSPAAICRSSPSGAYSAAEISGFPHSSVSTRIVAREKSSFSAVFTKKSRMWFSGRLMRYTSRKMPLMRSLSWSSRYVPSHHLSTSTATAFSPSTRRSVMSNSLVECETWL